jgi:hypothetical protein
MVRCGVAKLKRDVLKIGVWGAWVHCISRVGKAFGLGKEKGFEKGCWLEKCRHISACSILHGLVR